MAVLIDHAFDPSPLTFELSACSGKTVANHGLIDQRRSKRLPNCDIFEGSREGSASLRGDVDGDGESFVVEVVLQPLSAKIIGIVALNLKLP
jgi:hypothetical protein